MNLIAQKNVTGFYVQNGTSDIYDTAGTFMDSLPINTTAVVNKDGKTVKWDQTAGVKKWYDGSTTYFNEVAVVITNAVGEIYKSDWILWDKTFARKYNDYSAPAEKIDFIGYNGTSGSIDVVPAAANYKIGIKLIEESAAVQQAPLFKFVQYQALSTDGQKEVATGLIKNAIGTYKKESEPRIRFSRTGDGTVAAVTGTATIFKLTKGSTTVSAFIKAAAGNTTLTASTCTVAAGDILNVPSNTVSSFSFVATALGSGAGRYVIYLGDTAYNIADAGADTANATAITASINAGSQATATVDTATVTVTYRANTTVAFPLVLLSTDDSTFTNATVTVVTGNSLATKYIAATGVTAGASFTLDVPYQGETGYFYEGTSATLNFGIATVTNWGIKMAGLPLQFREGVKGYLKSNWQVTLYEEWGDTLLTNSVTPSKGVGTYEEVAETEWFLEGNDTRAMRVIAPQYISRKDAVLGNTYDIASFSWNDANTTIGLSPLLGSSQVSFKQFMFAVKSSTTDTIYKLAFGV